MFAKRYLFTIGSNAFRRKNAKENKLENCLEDEYNKPLQDSHEI
jgi:hypothetical protein